MSPTGDVSLNDLRPLARSLTEEDRSPTPPPPELWDRIEREALSRPSSPSPDPTAPVDPETVASVTGLDERRSRRLLWSGFAVAAVAAALVGLWALGSSDPEVVGRTELQAIGELGTGSAELIDTDDGLRLRVETADVEAADQEFLEVWLIDPEVTALVSLGPVRPDGLYDLPAGLDPATFPVVDISTEAYDGDPTHSGRSIVRGQLELS